MVLAPLAANLNAQDLCRSLISRGKRLVSAGREKGVQWTIRDLITKYESVYDEGYTVEVVSPGQMSSLEYWLLGV